VCRTDGVQQEVVGRHLQSTAEEPIWRRRGGRRLLNPGEIQAERLAEIWDGEGIKHTAAQRPHEGLRRSGRLAVRRCWAACCLAVRVRLAAAALARPPASACARSCRWWLAGGGGAGVGEERRIVDWCGIRGSRRGGSGGDEGF
jgi:hypothetical protein